MKMSGRFVLITVLLQLCLSVVNAGGGGSVEESVNENQVRIKDVHIFIHLFTKYLCGLLIIMSIIYLSSQLQFGDLLEFPNRKGNTIIYSHYAVYVGSEPIQGKEDNNHNVFEMTSMTSCLSNLLQNLLKIIIPTYTFINL